MMIYSCPRIDIFTDDDPTVSPITVLPAELLIEIFAYCISNEGHAPLTLRKVCSWWQNLVDTSPRLWQTIILDDGDGNIFTEQQAKLWTTRSQPLKYDIELNVEDPQYILPLLSPLLPSVDRWRSFRLSGNRDEEIILDDLNLTPNTLTHLHLCFHDNDQDDFDDDEPRITFSPISPDRASSYALNLWISNIPSPHLLPPLRFVHVTIAEGSQTGLHTQPRSILDFLTACPELESFFLSGWPHNTRIAGNLPVVFLPNLITLHLKSTCFVRVLLSCLNTPRLQNLYLSHLNVNFDLIGSYHDEGDSEDEAHDYSQSPSSDQATGMGLRRLITCCSPPIRVLEMDFSDMRTKDFLYVFDRLPLLEDFHIVASDMSDKVIYFFRPIRHMGYGYVTGLRLPRLRKLRLTNCQRLSGRAIVDSLSDRVKWSDIEYPDHTLTDVSISGCEGFTQWDRHILSTVLGPRLRPEA
ncbi:hypothetical protein BDZ97DRAFT_1904569 [Flammula alnicola]|nr:hypothetical protein BDZ97DRAFT_1904569 [Flammula alnicola]